MTQRIAICMIVKNEAELLPRALQDWRELADELIIVDTGSTDNTVEIAEQHGATVLHYDWQAPGHKGEARNLGIEAATAEWCVVLDADEVIRERADLRAALQEIPATVNAVNVRFENYDESNNVSLAWYQCRVFKRAAFRYVHREHEIPVPVSGHTANHVNCPVTFEHRPPPARAATKLSPMLQRLELDVQEHPDDPHPHYMLARQYLHVGEYAQALKMLDTFVDRYRHLVLADACRLASVACVELGDRRRASEWLHRAVSQEPKRRLRWVDIARMYYQDAEYELAEKYAGIAASLPLPSSQREVEPLEQLTYICTLIEDARAAQHMETKEDGN